MSRWIQTFSGVKFHPLSPRAEDVRLVDIAHALANTCRFAGHTTSFYSVACHSVMVSRAVPEQFARWGLLHDASEAYLNDLPSPIKSLMPEYKRAEEAVMIVIAEAFGLELPIPQEVKEADLRALSTERRDLMAETGDAWVSDKHQAFDVMAIPRPPQQSKLQFLARYREIFGWK